MNYRGLLAVLLSLVLAACSSSPRLSPLPTEAGAAYRIGPGDEIRLNVYGLDQLNTTYLVGDTGTISIPLLPPVSAGNKTVRELETDIAAAIRDRKLILEPSVSVQVQQYRPFFILGEVQKPGQYPYVPGMTVLSAVSIAGGYTFRANTKRMAVTRTAGGKAVRGAADPDTLLRPGDSVTIQESWF